MKLLHRDIIAVHEEVQQVDGQVSGCRTQPEAVADDGYEVCEVPPQVELRRLAFEGRQLELLFRRHMGFYVHYIKVWLQCNVYLQTYTKNTARRIK